MWTHAMNWKQENVLFNFRYNQVNMGEEHLFLIAAVAVKIQYKTLNL